MIQNIKRFGEMELKLLFYLEQRESFIFSFKDAKNVLQSSDASVKNVIKRLRKKNRIICLQKGTYLFAPLRSGEKGLWSEHAFVIVPALVKTENYYIGFISAMNYWGMTEQIPRTVYVALKRQKKVLEAVQTKFIFVKKPKLGDVTRETIQKTQINISSKEQTIIDALLFPEYCLGIEVVVGAIYSSRKSLNWDKFISLVKMEKSIVRRRLGYLLEMLKLKKYSKRLEEKFIGFNWLDHTSSKKVLLYSKKWGLKINISERELLNFMEGY
ncbi:MAG: type IV toxin-antitoxin system AbiEi family antitoxin [Candidatus Micrarchaeota archaeon]|nr:type IV toxin-antitoxin system AbiEi family antitoxin [Candidatus Micrarchaeota archaeon]